MRTELIKIRDPFKKVFDRRSYYTKVEYTINNESIVANMKIDTGADYTIIGLTDDCLAEYRNIILQSNMIGRAYDASGTELKLYGYIVENFRLTDDIILDRIKLFFSEDIGSKALLGMDILSLFDFQYLKEKRQNYGTFWINNYDETLKELETRKLNKDTDYIDPILIANIDDTNVFKEDQDT